MSSNPFDAVEFADNPLKDYTIRVWHQPGLRWQAESKTLSKEMGLLEVKAYCRLAAIVSVARQVSWEYGIPMDELWVEC